MRTAIAAWWLVALAVALGFGPAVAQNEEVINGCVRAGRLRIVEEPDECKPSETPLSWNTSGPAGPLGPSGPPGVTAAFVASQAGGLTLANEMGDVVSLDVPAGSYVLHAKVMIVSQNEISVRCRLLDPNGGQIDEAFVVVHEEQVRDSNTFLTGTDTIPLQSSIAETGGGTIKLQCQRAGSVFSGGIGSGSAELGKIDAIQVNTLN